MFIKTKTGKIVSLLAILIMICVAMYLIFKGLSINSSNLLKDASTPSEEVISKLSVEELRNYSSLPDEEIEKLEEAERSYDSLANIFLYIGLTIFVIKLGFILYEKYQN